MFPLTTDTASVPKRTTTFTATFLTENVAATAADLAYDMIGFSPKKAVTFTRVSTRIGGGWRFRFLRRLDRRRNGIRHRLVEDQTMILGDGTGPMAASRAQARFDAGVGSFVGAVDPTAAVDTFGEVTATDLAKAVGTIPTWALDAPLGIAASLPMRRVRPIRGGRGRHYVVDGEPPFWGLPIRISNVFPTTHSTINNTPMLYVGDLSAVYMGSRRDFRLKRSASRYIEFDQAAYFGSSRFDFAVDIGDATAAGGLVALMVSLKPCTRLCSGPTPILELSHPGLHGFSVADADPRRRDVPSALRCHPLPSVKASDDGKGVSFMISHRELWIGRAIGSNSMDGIPRN